MGEFDGALTPEQEDALMDLAYSNPPTMTAEEYEIENKAAAVEAFVAACKAVVEAVEELEALEIIGNEFEDLRSIASQAAYVFEPDNDDGRSLEDLS